jgi:hypothetical protein
VARYRYFPGRFKLRRCNAGVVSKGHTTPLFPELYVALSCVRTCNSCKPCNPTNSTPYPRPRENAPDCRHIKAHHTQWCSYHAAFRAEAPRLPAILRRPASFCVVNGCPIENEAVKQQLRRTEHGIVGAYGYSLFSDILPQFLPRPSILFRIFLSCYLHV